MIRGLICFILFISLDICAQSAERVESEYKLGIPNDEAESLWLYLQSETVFIKIESGI